MVHDLKEELVDSALWSLKNKGLGFFLSLYFWVVD
tara:strand:- start:403 stop:507 length:105 start_codon:yes stop_codon:yes gene_type:complete